MEKLPNLPTAKIKEQKVPKFMTEPFNITGGNNSKPDIYKEGGVVQNPFTGQSYELNALELSIYDYLMGCQIIATKLDAKWEETLNSNDLNPQAKPFWDVVRQGLAWFRRYNAEAYMILLD